MLDLLLAAEHNGLMDYEGIKEEVDTFTFEVNTKVYIRIEFNFIFKWIFVLGTWYDWNGHDFCIDATCRKFWSTGWLQNYNRVFHVKLDNV